MSDNISSFDEAYKQINKLPLVVCVKSYIEKRLDNEQFIQTLDENELEKIPVDKIIDYIKEISEDIANEVVSKFSLTFNDEYTSFTNDLIDYIMYNGLYDDVTEDMQEKADAYMRDNDISEDVKNIPSLKDNIGDTTELSNTIDIENRSAAFMDIDRYIFVSKHNGTHAELIDEYLQDYGQSLKDKTNRPQKQDLENLDIDENKIAFGHVIDDVFLIEDTNALSVDEVKEDIEKCYRYKKIYTYSVGENKITRLAKSI